MTETTNGGLIRRGYRFVSGVVSLLESDHTLVLTGATTLTLTAIALWNVGREIVVINRSGYTLTITTSGSDLINGVGTIVPEGSGVVDLKATALLTWDANRTGYEYPLVFELRGLATLVAGTFTITNTMLNAGSHAQVTYTGTGVLASGLISQTPAVGSMTFTSAIGTDNATFSYIITI